MREVTRKGERSEGGGGGRERAGVVGEAVDVICVALFIRR